MCSAGSRQGMKAAPNKKNDVNLRDVCTIGEQYKLCLLLRDVCTIGEQYKLCLLLRCHIRTGQGIAVEVQVQQAPEEVVEDCGWHCLDVVMLQGEQRQV